MTELCKSCARQNFCGNNITKYYCTGYMPYVETRWEADDIKVPPFTDEQKKVIEATEKLANGKLICDVDDDIDVLTNEDWIKSLDTEGLVDYLYEVHKGGNSVERQRWIENHKERVKMQFRGWLKQKHTNE